MIKIFFSALLLLSTLPTAAQNRPSNRFSPPIKEGTSGGLSSSSLPAEKPASKPEEQNLQVAEKEGEIKTLFQENLNEILVSEQKHLENLFKCVSEEAFFQQLQKTPSTSVCWRLLPFSNPLNRALALRQTSPFGYRFHPISKKWKLHKGIDFAAPTGSAVYAAGSGLVSGAGFDPLLGNFVRINHGFGWSSVYGHLSALYVRQGTVLRDAQLIGRSGSTGHSTGPHLHFGVYFRSKPVDGSRFLNLLKKLKGETSENTHQKQ